MNIVPVTDSSFKPYGKILEGYQTEGLVEAMRSIDMPEKGTAYQPGIEVLEKTDAYGAFRDRAYGGMPIQIGMCWGYNTRLNCLEYHRDSEVNIGESDFVLLLAKQSDIEEGGVLDTATVKAFRVPAGVPVEVYATTLHYAPCHVDPSRGFRVAVILPLGTNTEKPEYTPACDEDTWMTARNKWLLAHPESAEAGNGAHIGLKGVNIDIG